MREDFSEQIVMTREKIGVEGGKFAGVILYNIMFNFIFQNHITL